MSEEFLNGVILESPDSRNYKISQFNPNVDMIDNEEFRLKLPDKQIITDQADYSACVGYSFSMCKSILEYAQTNKWIDFDPFVIYGTRYDNMYQGIGMVPMSAAKILYKEGAYFKRDFNKKQEMMDLMYMVEEFKTKNPDLVKQAKDYAISGYAEINNINQVKLALKTGMPVSACWNLYKSFYKTGDDGVVKVPGKRDEELGCHQMTIVGWTSKKQWIVLNSWGINKGFKGVYLIPFEYKFESAIALSDTITPSLYKYRSVSFRVTDPYYTTDDDRQTIFIYRPYIDNNVIYVPSTFITKTLGASVEHIPATQAVLIRSEEGTISGTVGGKYIKINNYHEVIDIESEFRYENGKLMIPIKPICEHFNCSFKYDEDTKTVTINAL